MTPSRLALANANGSVSFSGLAGDEATRGAILDAIRKAFGDHASGAIARRTVAQQSVARPRSIEAARRESGAGIDPASLTAKGYGAATSTSDSSSRTGRRIEFGVSH